MLNPRRYFKSRLACPPITVGLLQCSRLPAVPIAVHLSSRNSFTVKIWDARIRVINERDYY